MKLLDTYNSPFKSGDDIYYYDNQTDEIIESKWDSEKTYDLSLRYYKDHDDIVHDLTYHLELFNDETKS